jgi:hypothetical protein
MKSSAIKRVIAIAAFLLVLCLAAGSWASAASTAHLSDSSNGIYQLAAGGVAALVRLSSAMTEAGILLCLGASLVALSAVLQRARN